MPILKMPFAQRQSSTCAASLVLLVCLAILAGPVGPSGRGGGTALAAPTPEMLAHPPTLVNRSSAPDTVEVDLVAAPARLSLIPGKTHTFWAYNGQIPGPTLEVREGDRVIVHFQNKLPEVSTVHWHGLPVPVAADGNPLDPVEPGKRYDYVFTVPRGTAGTYWYHPHPHGRAGKQVARGLYGALIVHAAEDPLPPSLPQKLIMLSDARITSYGAFVFPQPSSEEQGWEGNVVFINGQRQPTIPIRAGETQRWRVINASLSRYYRLALPGHTFLHVANDGGLFERPVPREEILLGPSERVELLIRGTGTPGSQVLLQALPYDRYFPFLRPVDWDRTFDLLTVAYTPDAPIESPAIPESLRQVPATDAAAAVLTRTLVMKDALINGKRFSHNRVDFTARLGDTEIWSLQNREAMDHPFHMHGFRFQVLDRAGVPEPFLSWEDTVNVPKGQTVTILVHFDENPGKRMFHCHIMDHEDYGMMGILEVK